MADLNINFAGIYSPNPFWIASGPASNTSYQVARAFDAGWGGAVWKTIGEPIINVYSRYSAVYQAHRRMIGLNNIELISDRPLKDNLKDLAYIKKRYPKNALIASIIAESTRSAWREIVKQVEDTGVDGLELNFSCPHGMSERGMGAAVGQVPAYVRMITEWVKETATKPIIVKLTPNISDITLPALAAVKARADGLSLINTVASITGVDLDSFVPRPAVGDASTHGGYAGQAIKPIALYMVSKVCSHPKIKIPVSGIGGVTTWRDAAEFILLGSTSVQVCTAIMHYGFRIIEDLIDGLNNWMDEKGFKTIEDFRGKALQHLRAWGDLNLNYRVVARIDETKCIGCQLCYIACQDATYQAIKLQDNRRIPVVDEKKCKGCNLCFMICPVEGCIKMVEIKTKKRPISWNELQRR